jgi:ABC-type sugar transport system permease subunit
LFWILLSPALAVLAAVTLIPFLFLFSTSLTPLNLARPATWWDFSAHWQTLWSSRAPRFLNPRRQLRLSVSA